MSSNEDKNMSVLNEVMNEETNTPYGTVVEIEDVELCKQVMRYASKYAIDPSIYVISNDCRTRLGNGKFKIEWNGEVLYVYKDIVGMPVKYTGNGDKDTVLPYMLTICSIDAGKIEIIEEFCREAKSSDTAPGVYQWDHQRRLWYKVSEVCRKTFEDVHFDANEKEDFMKDIEHFMNTSTKEKYAQHNIQYKRTYMFNGKHGSGKTSMAAALAHRYNMNVYMIHIQSEMTDSTLLEATGKLPPKSIVLYENIHDYFTDAGEKQDEFFLTHSGLTQALNGISSQSCVINILTCTNSSNTSPELLSKSRINKIVNFALTTGDDMFALIKKYVPSADTRFMTKLKAKNMTQGEIINILMSESFVSLA